MSARATRETTLVAIPNASVEPGAGTETDTTAKASAAPKRCQGPREDRVATRQREAAKGHLLIVLAVALSGSATEHNTASGMESAMITRAAPRADEEQDHQRGRAARSGPPSAAVDRPRHEMRLVGEFLHIESGGRDGHGLRHSSLIRRATSAWRLRRLS